MKSLLPQHTNRFGTGFTAGLAAGIVASGVMLFLSVTIGGISLPESFGSQLTAFMSPAVFNFLHQLIGADAKHYFFYGILIGQCLVFALSGGLYNLRANPLNKPLQWSQGLLLALILWLFAGLVLLPLTGSGVFGANLTVGFTSGILSLAVVGLAFGLCFVFAQRWLVNRHVEKPAGAEDSSDENLSRRSLLTKGAVIIGAGVIGVGLWHFITGGFSTAKVPVTQLLQHYKNKVVPPPVPNYGTIYPARFLSPEVTPNDQYYVVSKNLFADPSVNASTWHLTVDGQVEQPYSLTYTDLLAFPMQRQYESMMCISNEVGGEYMSNALWEGVRLADLLQRAGVKPGSTKVVLHAADDYTDSIHLSKALEPTTLLAVRMNNAPLPQGHGFPARLLVPGIYGMKHCKWMTHIEVVNYDFQGYWQQRGWDDAAPIRLTSRIDTPLDGTSVTANQTTYIAGVAFSGNQGISEVDVSLDEGRTWQKATLKQPLSNLTWVLWELPWQPKKGSYTVTVRAIDLEGNVQDPTIEPPLPKGSSGYHSITVNVL